MIETIKSAKQLYLKINFTYRFRIELQNFLFREEKKKEKKRKERGKKIRLNQLRLIFIHRIAHFYNPSITRRIEARPMKPDIDSNSKQTHEKITRKKDEREERDKVSRGT